jgi:hypothetical protein
VKVKIKMWTRQKRPNEDRNQQQKSHPPKQKAWEQNDVNWATKKEQNYQVQRLAIQNAAKQN